MPDRELEEIRPAEKEASKPAGDFEDIPIRCMDCGEEFTWTSGEQTFYQSKGLLNPPKRCKECKKAKNRRLEAVQSSRLTGKRHHYEVRSECAKCSQVTTVPFYPSQGRPVYCRPCFLEMNGKDTKDAKAGGGD